LGNSRHIKKGFVDMTRIRQAILPIAGLGTRFLPLSKTFPKELWPLVDRPVLDYVVEEVKDSGVKEIVFVVSPEKKKVLDYFKPSPETEKLIRERGKTEPLEKLRAQEKRWQGLTFSSVWQKRALGDGHAVLQARKKVRPPVMVSFGDDIVLSKTPCLLQLSRVFQKFGQPLIALKRVPKEKIPLYGSVKVKRIAPRLYQVQKIVEKSSVSQAPSNLVVVGKYILTQTVFDYLERTPPSFRGEIILEQAFEKMLKEGIMIQGYEFEGKWLECGNVQNWLLSNLFLAKKLNLL